MRRLLLVQPSLQPPGGGSAVAAWMLQALAPEHRVTVLSWRPVETEPINRFFGTSLDQSQFETLLAPRAWTLADRLPVPAALLRSSLLMRYARRVSDRFDLVVGCHNEADYGRRSIQYVHYPAYLRPRPAVDERWYHRPRAALDLYYRLADRAAGASLDRLRSNLTLVNSDWTGARVERLLGSPARTIYPPVADAAPPPPWETRARGFVALGIAPEKEIERIAAILARVRARHPDVTLTVIGTPDGRARRYLDGLFALAARLGPWLRLRTGLSREAVRRCLAEHRYGIHGMREEHFGIAPAEMARAGMIVWVPNGGGQVEIVGDEPLLRYDDEEEAAAKIAGVLSNPSEEERLRNALLARAPRFSSARFLDEIRSVVREFRE